MKFDIPTIESERLILRPLTLDDADDVFEWTGDELVARYMIYPTHTSIDITKMWLSSLETLENEYTWGVVRKSDRKLIGSVGIRYRTDEKVWSFGYNFRRDSWNQGFATEASRRAIKYAYDENGAREFIAGHAVENTASGRVIEKCGLTFEKYGEFSKFDGSVTFKAKEYRMKLE